MRFVRIVPILLIFTLSTFSHSKSGELSPDLKNSFQVADRSEYLSCLIMLKDQLKPENQKIYRELKNREEKHSNVIYRLKDKKIKSQKNLLIFLDEQKRKGTVESYQDFWIVNGILISATMEIIEGIAKKPEVEIIYPNYPVALIAPFTDTSSSFKTGVRDDYQVMGVRELWKMGYTGKGRLVCGFDTGVEWTHPALYGNWNGGLQGGNSRSWFDPYGSLFPVDANGHGTHSMGIMVGRTEEETLGVAFDAKWIAAGIIDRGKDIDQTIADILLAFEWAIDPDGNPETIDDVPDVINNSWGIPLAAKPPCDQTFWAAIDNVEAAGAIVVFAAGNEGPALMTLRTPADRVSTATNSFSVGAVDSYIDDLPVASFSSRGPSGCDGVSIKPEICAPGVGIRSSYLNGTYKLLNGTSTAVAFISGAVALLREFNPEATAEEIKNALLLSATDLGPAGEDNDYGWGLLNLKKALDFMPSPPYPKVWLDSAYVTEDTVNYPEVLERQRLYFSFKNYGEKIDSLNVVLYTQDSSVVLCEDSLYIDSIGSKKTETNINSPLVLSYDENLPLNYTFTFRIRFFNNSGEYVDSLQYSITLNQEEKYFSAEHDAGNVVFSISNSGIYGLGGRSIFAGQGQGFRYPKTGEDNLFEGAFLIGKSRNQVMDGARDQSGNSSQNDFVPLGELTIDKPGEVSDQDGTGIFLDTGAENQIGLEIIQRSFAFSNPPDDDYVMLEYTIKNKNLGNLDGIYAGLFFDWDININTPKDDFAGRDSILNMKLAYQYDSTSSVYLTIFPLNHPPASCKLVDNQLFLYDGFTEEEKYLFLSGDTLIDSDTASYLVTGDWSQIISCGPFDIPAAESVVVAFAVIAGDNLFDLKENVKSARLKYHDLKTEVESEQDLLIPDVYSLSQNYPNPFNPTTRIQFRVGRLEFGDPVHTSLIIYNILGQKVRTMVNEERLPGSYEVNWDGKDERGNEVCSGIYFYRIEAGKYRETRKMILLR
ncbi:MAG: S8 family serine peptidase [candidate division Zixibacteria bacterium]|nr:S8 family serine peptidase [candidate division Zixibacteria bacterium]